MAASGRLYRKHAGFWANAGVCVLIMIIIGCIAALLHIHRVESFFDDDDTDGKDGKDGSAAKWVDDIDRKPPPTTVERTKRTVASKIGLSLTGLVLLGGLVVVIIGYALKTPIDAHHHNNNNIGDAGMWGDFQYITLAMLGEV